jgi:hypothetical protein
MNADCTFVHFTPADENVKLHWAITGMLARTYEAKWAYSVWLDEGSIDVYFANKQKSFYLVPSDYKAIWVDTRPAIMKANGNKPLIFWSSAVSPGFIQRHMEDPDKDRNLATLYLTVLILLKQDSYFKAVNARVWQEYVKMYPGLKADYDCECSDCQKEREEKEIDALILPIVNHLKKRIREEIKKEERDGDCECSQDEFCSCELPPCGNKECVPYQCNCFK